MKIELSKTKGLFGLKADTESGHSIVFDAAESIGGGNQGVRPMEAVAASLAACASIDVLHILNKQKITPEDYRVEVDAKRKDTVPGVFESIHLNFKFKGVEIEKAERAVKLSIEKYCSVSKMIEQTAKIIFSITLI